MQGFRTLNDVKSKSHEYQNFITHQDVQNLFWSFLHLTLFKQSIFQISKNEN
jgi:hypothetical protein